MLRGIMLRSTTKQNEQAGRSSQWFIIYAAGAGCILL
jgi:hypothetical protein